MATRTIHLGLGKPGNLESGWGAILNANWELIDGLAGTIGQFAVRATDLDATTGAATSLKFTIAAGTWIKQDGSTLAVPATSGNHAATASAITYVWHDGSGDPGTGAAFPASGTYLPLAAITADTTKITAITDKRGPVPFLRSAPTLFLPALAYASTAYTATSSDTVIFAVATGGAFSVKLPVASPAEDFDGRVITVIKRDASANAVTVDGNGATINGAATYALTSQYQRVTAMFSATTGVSEWCVLSD